MTCSSSSLSYDTQPQNPTGAETKLVLGQRQKGITAGMITVHWAGHDDGQLVPPGYSCPCTGHCSPSRCSSVLVVVHCSQGSLPCLATSCSWDMVSHLMAPRVSRWSCRLRSCLSATWALCAAWHCWAWRRLSENT